MTPTTLSAPVPVIDPKDMAMPDGPGCQPTASAADASSQSGIPIAPPGYHFDAFADVRMGRSLFQMAPEDWLVRDKSGCQYCDGYCHGGCKEGY